MWRRVVVVRTDVSEEYIASVGTSHNAPGVSSRTGYLTTEQSNATVENASRHDRKREILLHAKSSIVRTRKRTTVATIVRRPATNVETKT
jgi:hypothetical protein